MAYNPTLYNPYGSQQFQPVNNFSSFIPNNQPVSQQSVNGLIRIESIEGAQMYALPPNSVSPPMFLSEENAFVIKTTDGGGAATLKKYTFDEAPLEETADSNYVTKDYLDNRIKELMEAINGKHAISEPTQEFNPQPTAANPVAGSIQPAIQPNVQ